MARIPKAMVMSLLLWCALRPGAAIAYDMVPVEQAMQALVDEHALPGASVYVSKHGEPILSRSFGGYDANTRIPIASASKWLSALAIARLVEQGRLDWDDTIGEHLPAAPADKRAITLGQLFSHTSGLPYGDSPCLGTATTTLAACSAQILDLPLIGAPGTVFAYGGNSMQVAGRMAEAATGMAWDDIFIDTVVLPLGLTATDWAAGSTQAGYVRRTNPRIGGGVRTTLGDYARAIDMLAANGQSAGATYLAPATLAAMERDRAAGTTVLYAAPAAVPGWGYGIGQWIEAREPGRRPSHARVMVSSPGAFGFTPWVDHRAGIGGIVMVRGENAAVRTDIQAIQALVATQTASLPVPIPRRPQHTKAAAPTGAR